jgi:cell division cycle protein 20 (cofactor of APC complex)
VANYNLRLDDVLTSGSLDTSPAKEQYKRTLNAQLFGGRARSHVLSHDDHANASTASAALLDTMPRSAFGSPQKKCHRSIPRTPLRILDAPEMLEDYYLNLLDWSRRNVIVVALARSVYLWNASCGEITKLMELDAAESCITSVRWTETGEHLAVGTSDCDVQLWDATTLKRVRRMRGHQGRVSVLAWHGHQLASGSRDATVHVHDVRAATHVAQTLSKHTQEVCGLAWSADGILASGGNDNLINLWEPARAVTPRHTLAHHTAAVKGLAWCPWQQNLLASGGGTADRTIRFWDVSNGACLNAIDTKSQVCAILWSSHYRELVSSHGFSQNQLIVWQYPSMVKVCELTGHTSRVLHMAMSPDGETVVSASGDETLRFWRVFERRRPSVSLGAAEQRATELALPSMSIR